MLRSLLTFACVWLVASACCAAASPKITIAGQVFDTFGKRVSKAGIARLAQITPTGVRMSDSNAYLPAGEVLLVGKGKACARDRRGQQWCLAVTRDGLPLYVLAGGQHFLKFNGQQGVWVFARREGNLTHQGGVFSYSTSERYQVYEQAEPEKTVIIVDQSSDKGLSSPIRIDITDRLEDFAFVVAEDLDDPAAFPAIRPVFDGELITRIRDSIRDFELDDEAWENVQASLDRFLIREKECGRPVSFSFDVTGDAEAGFGRMLSAVSAKLKVTASYRDSTQYPATLRFRARRFIQEDPLGGQRFFEVWERFQYASGDCTAIQLTSITAYDDEDNGGERGELTSTSARNLGLGTSGTQLFPSYSCDREYFRAVEHLKSADGRLSHETATLVVTYIMRLDGKGTGIKVCDNNASF